MPAVRWAFSGADSRRFMNSYPGIRAFRIHEHSRFASHRILICCLLQLYRGESAPGLGLSKVNVGTVPSTVRGSRGNDPKKYLGKEGRRAFTLEELV